MFDIGFSEIVLTCIVGLVVLGPQRLPVAIRTVMSWVRTIRGLAANVQNELKQELKLQELQESIKKAESLNLKALSPELGKTVEELKASADKLRAELEQRATETDTSLEDQIDLMRDAVDNPAEYVHIARPNNNQADTTAEPDAETPSKTTALSPAERAEQAEIELDEKLARYINQYDPDNPPPAAANAPTTDESTDKS